MMIKHKKLYIGFLIFLSVLLVRWFYVFHYGVNVPFWDQWDGEGASLLLPFLHHHLTFKDLIAPHNEHRIFFTRILDLLVFIINGSTWNVFRELLAQSVIPAISVFLMAIFLYQDGARKKYHILLYAILFLAFANPFDRVDMLWAFQSQFYFLVLFTIIALRLVSKENLSLVRFIFVLFFSLCAFFSSAGGMFTPIAVASGYFFFSIKNPKKVRWLFYGVLMLGAAFLMYHFTPKPAFEEKVLYAHSLLAFLHGLYKTFFPYVINFVFWLLCAILLLLTFKRDKLNLKREHVFCLLAILWIMLEFVAMAYSRQDFSGRYLPILFLSYAAIAFLLIKPIDNANKIFSVLFILCLCHFWVLHYHKLDELKNYVKSAKLGLLQYKNCPNTSAPNCNTPHINAALRTLYPNATYLKSLVNKPSMQNILDLS